MSPSAFLKTRDSRGFSLLNACIHIIDLFGACGLPGFGGVANDGCGKLGPTRTCLEVEEGILGNPCHLCCCLFFTFIPECSTLTTKCLT